MITIHETNCKIVCKDGPYKKIRTQTLTHIHSHSMIVNLGLEISNSIKFNTSVISDTFYLRVTRIIHLARKNSPIWPHIFVSPSREYGAKLRKFLWLDVFSKLIFK